MSISSLVRHEERLDSVEGRNLSEDSGEGEEEEGETIGRGGRERERFEADEVGFGCT